MIVWVIKKPGLVKVLKIRKSNSIENGCKSSSIEKDWKVVQLKVVVKVLLLRKIEKYFKWKWL